MEMPLENVELERKSQIGFKDAKPIDGNRCLRRCNRFMLISTILVCLIWFFLFGYWLYRPNNYQDAVCLVESFKVQNQTSLYFDISTLNSTQTDEEGLTSTLVFRNIVNVFYDTFPTSSWAYGNGTYFLEEAKQGFPMNCYYKGRDNTTVIFIPKFDLYGTIFASTTLGFAILFTVMIMIYFFFEFREIILKEKKDREIEMEQMARMDESQSLDAASFSQVKLSEKEYIKGFEDSDTMSDID